MSKKIGMVSLGCAKNQVDAEVMLGLLDQADFEIINRSEQADIIIINTCGFIGPAKEESIEAILEQAAYKSKGQCEKIIVTGCLAERYGVELLEEIPEIDSIVGTSNYANIVNIVNKNVKDAKEDFDICQWDILESNPPRVLSTLPGTAYLKIAEGCNNCCSYCVIPQLRGNYQSRTLPSLIEEARALAAKGVRELIVIAQDVTRYGHDLAENINLVVLLKELCKIPEFKWIRLLYCYPDMVTDELLDLMAKEDKICNYLDIPFQHINDKIVHKMNRRFNRQQAIGLMDKIRKKLPDAIIRTTFIVGFPGEGEEEFEELKTFIQEYPFNRGGVFIYSREEGTPAADYPQQVDGIIKERRRNDLMEIQQKISKKLNKQRIGQICDVLIEETNSSDLYLGRTYGEAPGIDGHIYVISSKPLKPGGFVKVKITKSYNYDLLGEHYELSK